MACFFACIAVFLTILYLIWKRTIKNFKYFEENQIPHLPGYPIFGSSWKEVFTRKAFPEVLQSYMQKFPSHRFFGIYSMGGNKTFVLQDPELINELCVRNFDNFVNHPQFFTSTHDELLNSSLTILRDQKWRDMRTTLSPAFTGSKMRMMFDLVRECAEDFVTYCKENVNKDTKTMEIDTKDIFSKVAINVISSTAFGLKVDSVREPENIVTFHTKRAFDGSSFTAILRLMTIMTLPKVADFFKISFTPKTSQDFFRDLVKDTIDHRRQTKETRKDVIQLLIQAQDGTLKYSEDENNEKSFAVVEESEIGRRNISTKQWSDTDIAAQCFLFFVAGFDTTSSLLTFLTYELALNEDYQEKLFQEVQKTKCSLRNGSITYDALQQMEYLDAFVSEVLRFHPPSVLTDRVCNQDTLIFDHNDRQYTIPKGAHIWMNIYGIHHSHKYFANPTRFDPERFLGVNKKKIVSGSFMPFGVGPRACIGTRFALMEAKLVIYTLLSEFKFKICDKTLVPMQYGDGFSLTPKVPLIVELEKRVK
ncbi:probable cytochrome P450 9f2 [Culicoides brevitarsis]|uniref:probable cytochrome P450 9f2 n=1 Tax=Culicoides brevitarsis TaxID=469753 RepID=UPI00307C9C2D